MAIHYILCNSLGIIPIYSGINDYLQWNVAVVQHTKQTLKQYIFL